MAHKTLIGGTAYEVKGGKTLVSDTVYEVSGGKTLVGGTAYDISFVNFVLVYDLGSVAVTDGYSPGEGAYCVTIRGVGVPTGYDKCNMIIIDEVMYELVQTAHWEGEETYYRPKSYVDGDPDACPLQMFIFIALTESIEVRFPDAGIYNIQIGYVE